MSDKLSSFTRTIENVPILGHFVSMCHACAKKPSHAERAAIKATLGICMCICNCPTECVDDCSRHKSPKLLSHSLTSRPEWMRKYHNFTLRQLCLPGSHQSTTYHVQKKLDAIPMSAGWSRCQDLSLSAQLRGGIRFLDLRIMSEKDGEVWTHHNVIKCLTLKEVLDTVKSFVADHPTEIVGMALDNDGKPIDWDVCRSLLNEYLGERLIREHMRDMLIGDIIDQGKNVFIYGVPNVAFSWKGINCYWPNKEWPDDLRENMEQVMMEQNQSESTQLFWYKAECTPGPHMIARGIGGVPGAAIARCADEKFEFTEDVAAAVNHIVYEIISGVEQSNFQILSTDFVQDEVVDRIIELNKQSLKHDETFIISSQNQTLRSEASNENILRSANLSTSVVDSPSKRMYSPLPTTDHSFMSNSGGSGFEKSVSVSFSADTTPQHTGRRSASPTKPRQNISIRSSQNTLAHNITSGSCISGQFEMAGRKAPPVEVKETTM